MALGLEDSAALAEVTIDASCLSGAPIKDSPISHPGLGLTAISVAGVVPARLVTTMLQGAEVDLVVEVKALSFDSVICLEVWNVELVNKEIRESDVSKLAIRPRATAIPVSG